MKIFNCTQHAPTLEQQNEGVYSADKINVSSLLTFDSIPDQKEMEIRAEKLSKIANDTGAEKAMIGGAPFFMATLERAMFSKNIEPVYAFSKRVSSEKEVDGKIVKINKFKHIGFVGTERCI